MADDLCHDCQMDEYSHYDDPDWIRKYMNMTWHDEDMKQEPQTEFIMVKGDITTGHNCEAIVNAANTSLLGGVAVLMVQFKERREKTSRRVQNAKWS